MSSQTFTCVATQKQKSVYCWLKQTVHFPSIVYVCHAKHNLCFLVCSGHTIAKPLLLFSSTFSPPEMAQKVPAYSICWDKIELQKEYFLEGKLWGLPQCLASKTCKQLASFHKQTVHIKRVCSFLSIQAEKPKCLGV